MLFQIRAKYGLRGSTSNLVLAEPLPSTSSYWTYKMLTAAMLCYLYDVIVVQCEIIVTHCLKNRSDINKTYYRSL